MIEDLITYVTDLVKNKEISFDTMFVKYKKTNSGQNYETQEYKIFHPHYRYKKYKPIISFPNILDNAINIFKRHNRFMINDQVITMSNIEGQKNIELLYYIYNEDIRRIDSNSKRLIINRVKESGSSMLGEITMDKINEEYQSGNMDPALKSIIKQIILEGIARMTDTYVERTINKFDGYKYFDYNIKHSI